MQDKDSESQYIQYKLDALGDYAEAIHCYGTTDLFSTQLVSSFKLI